MKLDCHVSDRGRIYEPNEKGFGAGDSCTEEKRRVARTSPESSRGIQCMEDPPSVFGDERRIPFREKWRMQQGKTYATGSQKVDYKREISQD